MARMASTIGILLLAVGALAASGCQSLVGRSGLAKASDPDTQQFYPPRQMIGVEFHGDNGKVEIEELPLEPGMTVEDALTKSKAHKKFRRLQVDLGRTPGGQAPHKMAIDYDNGKNHVKHTTNYALHPGDRVIVKKDNRSMMDDLMTKVLKTSPKRL